MAGLPANMSARPAAASASGHGSRYAKQGWENADFPILCETCLGDNPYLRMTKDPYGKECKVCARPFTIFRWRPGTQARYKKTEICQTCSKTKNVCQTCLLDLQYGLPVQVIDQALSQVSATPIPASDVNREWFTQINQQALADGTVAHGGKAASNPVLNKLARNTPYYKRNLAHVCSFWQRGTCTRGSSCPYRHSDDHTDPDLAHQNIKDRYYGKDDPVAAKMMKRAAAIELTPPEDKDIKTLYVGNVPAGTTEEEIRDVFYAYGEISSIKLAPQKMCAFVSYSTRAGAENAANKLYTNATLRGMPVRLAWGRSQVLDLNESIVSKKPVLVAKDKSAQPAESQQQSRDDDHAAPAFEQGGGSDMFSIPPMASTVYAAPNYPAASVVGPPRPLYPSMNPQRMGAIDK